MNYQKKTNNKFYVVSVLIALTCLLVSILSAGHAWFTSEARDKVKIVVSVANIDAKIYYENSSGTRTELLSDGSVYIPLSGEIKPDTANSVKIVVSNTCSGAADIYVRYKFEVYAKRVDSNVNLTGRTLAGTSDFTLNSSTGYYTKNAVLKANAETTLFTSFTIPLSEYISNGLNGETIYLKLTVEGSLSSSF